MNKVSINVGNSNYDILIDRGILNETGDIIKNYKNYRRAVILTDSTVNSLYGNILKQSLDRAGIINHFIILEPGEEKKSFVSVERIIKELINSRITRSDLFITFGGGVICDLGGFVASIYQRGIDLVHIPTTLLAQVDASIGGKVGINLAEGKNLVGAFLQPKLVITDVKLLETMDDRIFRDGMGEVIKYGCIDSLSVFEKLEETSNRLEVRQSIVDIISLCVSIKSKFVANDEFDKGIRNTLNFGHTIGHALEKYTNYEKYLHGEAVAIGMYNTTVLSEAFSYSKPGTAQRLKEILIRYNLPYNLEVPIKDILDLITYDKKYTGTSIKLVILKEIGESFIKEFSLEELDVEKLTNVLRE